MQKYLLSLIFWLFSLSVFAQKIPLSHDVYDIWKSIPDRQISNDGRWIIYALNPQEGDGNLVFYQLNSSKIDSIKRGAELKITYDSKYAIFKIKPQTKLVKEAKHTHKKKEEMPKDSLGIYDLSTSEIRKIPAVLSYKIPEKMGEILAYQVLTTLPKNKKDTLKSAPKVKISKKENEENGYKLILQSLKNEQKQRFPFVTDYILPKNGRCLAFSSTGNDSTMEAGVYVWDVEKSMIQKIYATKGKVKKMSFSEDGKQLAFVADLDTNSKTLIRYPKLFYWKYGENIATILADSAQNPAPKNWLISSEFMPKFSKDGTKLFFGTNPKPMVKDTTLLPDEIVSLDIWNWQDKRLISQQNASLELDKKKSYLAVIDLKEQKYFQLSNLEIPDYQLANEGNAAYILATSAEKYSNQHWDWHNTVDIFSVATNTEKTTRIATNIKAGGTVAISPEGKFIYWFSLVDTAWFAYSLKTQQTIRLTMDKKMANEEDDHPDFPNPYGLAGWSKNDEKIVLYDKYDLWSIDPNNPQEPVNLTQGRTNKMTFRYLKLDEEERSIDLEKPMILRVFDNISKQSGYFELKSAEKPSELIFGKYNYSAQIWKAKNADKVIFTRSNFQEFPDLFVSDLSFTKVQKISDANSQQQKYHWGNVELVKWKSLDGVDLEGLLYKPENFDSTKKYPMITYYYEKNAEKLFQYYEPQPIRSALNISYFVSNGYVIFVPDIVYKIGYPGQSAYNCVMPGIFNLLDKGFIDKNRLGIQGHSWGGYQTAFLVTQTTLFRAAEAGAPVANMTSAYGGIRWGTGLARQAQYEFDQSRIGGTLWEKPMQYIENSPLFYLPKVETPLLILHNDGDDAVPWYQGIELFLGLKRLNKPTWMLTYNAEKHGVMERRNRKDFTIRMSQFFDYYLKDAPMPIWMKEGVPSTEKTINYGLGLEKNK